MLLTRSLLPHAMFAFFLPGALLCQEAAAAALAERVATFQDEEVATLYRERQHKLLWLDEDGRLNAAGHVAMNLLRHATDHGLDSSLYGVPELDAKLAGAVPEPDFGWRAEMELALSEGVIRLLRDLRRGHARPASLPSDSAAVDIGLALTRAAGGDSLPALARAMAPPFRQYALLQAALVRERALLDSLPGDTATLLRVERISLALERLRWAPRNVRGRMIVINVPSFELLAFDAPGGGARQELRSRAVVGSADRSPTPMLFDEMTMVEFWPYWNVPRSILLNEILPSLRRDAGHLRNRDMEVVNSRGMVVGDRATADILAGLANGSFTVRQRPSRTNALGVVKFLFPNSASVYAHDTPNRELFDRERRDFSHGCIRVEEAASLAQWVMADEPGWTPARVREALRGPTTLRVTLHRSISVLIIYTTAVAGTDGQMRYFDDLYGLDHRLAQRLREP